MRGNALQYPDKQVTATVARAQLSVLLNGCTDERLAGFTVDNLATMYRLKREEIGAMLARARGIRDGSISPW